MADFDQTGWADKSLVYKIYNELKNRINSLSGSLVDSVTGNIVDNTDPSNPVITQVQTDWDEVAGLGVLLNKPNWEDILTEGNSANGIALEKVVDINGKAGNDLTITAAAGKDILFVVSSGSVLLSRVNQWLALEGLGLQVQDVSQNRVIDAASADFAFNAGDVDGASNGIAISISNADERFSIGKSGNGISYVAPSSGQAINVSQGLGLDLNLNSYYFGNWNTNKTNVFVDDTNGKVNLFVGNGVSTKSAILDHALNRFSITASAYAVNSDVGVTETLAAAISAGRKVVGGIICPA